MITDLQKIIYDVLFSNFTNIKIFTHIEKNTDFPFVFIDIVNSKDISNFTEEIKNFEVEISIFDKNTTNSFALELGDKIEDILSIVENFNDKNIIDVKFFGQTISMQSEKTIWQNKLKFNFITKKSLQI